MSLFRLVGLFAMIPATLLLTVSFFVLLVVRKAEPHGLKAFGYVIAGLLWACTLLIFAAGVYTISTGRHPLLAAIHHMGAPKHCTMTDCHMSQMAPAQK